MSQQGGSSMVSSSIPNSEVKYQKALKEISKLINTNKILKSECEQREQILSSKLNQQGLKCEEWKSKYEQSEHQKMRMQQFMQELQDTNQDLRKQCQTLQRQVAYLNDVLTQQNGELKKLSVFKDEKGISQLFRSYQQREDTYRKEISRLEEHISQLKGTIERIEDDLMQQTQMRQRYQEQYNIIGLEINKYRELNNYLMDKNQHILGEERNNSQKGTNQRQIESVILEMKRQLQMLRNVKYSSQDPSQKQYIQNYQLLMEEKNNLALELARVKDQLTVSESKIKELYDTEEKMSTAIARSDILIEENNILKNRITILQSKQIVDSAGFDEDSDLKVFEDKISFMMSKNDPTMVIKNSDENSHFTTMKSFITDLQVKLQSVIEQKQSIEKKYKNIKMKFNKKAEENIILEGNNKLLKGKLEGFERLTEKLNYELERSMQAHENEIVKMVAITNNLVGKKVEESRTASAFIKSQFDIQLQKAQRAQKSLSQELETLRLQNSTLKIKLSDMQVRQRQSLELREILQQKVSELGVRVKQLQKENGQVRERGIKYQKLYEEEKVLHETVLGQKQRVSQEYNKLQEEIAEKSYKYEESLRLLEENLKIEAKRIKGESIRTNQQLQLLREENKRVSFQLQQYRMRQTKTMNSLKEETSYIKELQTKYQQTKQLAGYLQNQLIGVKNKLSALQQIKQKHQLLEQQIITKNNELNNTKRQNIELKNQLQSEQLNIASLKEHNQLLTQEVAALKDKLYQPNLPVSSSHSKQLQYKKTIQQLHEEIALLQSTVRDEKRNANKFNSEKLSYKQEIQRLQQVIDKNKAKQNTLQQTIQTLNNEIITLQDQLFQFKSRYNQTAATSNNLNQQVQRTTQKVIELTQQLASTNARLFKIQTAYSNLVKDINSTKYYLQQGEKMLQRLNSVPKLQWQQQREKDNLSSLIDTLNRIIKNNENLQLSNTSSNQQYSFVPSSSFGNFDPNYRSEATYSENIRVTFDDSYGNEEGSKTNNLITNDSFKYRGSSNFQEGSNVNFSSDSFSRQSQAGVSYNAYDYA